MKVQVFVGLILLFTNCFAQTENQKAIGKSKKFITYLRTISISKSNVEENRLKLYDTIINLFFDTVVMKKEFMKNTNKFSLEKMKELQKLFLWQFHAYTLMTTEMELTVKNAEADRTILEVDIKDKSDRHQTPDFYIGINPKTNCIVGVSRSLSAFNGKEDKLYKLIPDE